MFAGGDTIDEHLEAMQGARFVGYGPHLVVGPMYHTGPLSGMRCVAAGTPAVILGRFDPEATLSLTAQHACSGLVVVPVMLQRILELDDEVLKRYDL